MFGFRWFAVLRMKGLTVAFAFLLAPAFAAQAADSCDDARKAAEQIDPNLQKVMRLMPRTISNDDPADRQKAICEQSRLWVEIETESVRRHESADQACGARIRWEKCDTACAREELRKKEKEAAHQCDPARITEAVKKAQQEKEQRENDISSMDACSHVALALEKSDASKPEWPAWIRACNETDRDTCVLAWLALERSRIPTTGLTCRPTAQERAKFK